MAEEFARVSGNQPCMVGHGVSGSQEKALQHAFKLPNLKRLVYSTCSSHSIEGEEVIQKVMPLATQLGFSLEVIFAHCFHNSIGAVYTGRQVTVLLNSERCVDKTIQEKDQACSHTSDCCMKAKLAFLVLGKWSLPGWPYATCWNLAASYKRLTATVPAQKLAWPCRIHSLLGIGGVTSTSRTACS